MYAYKCIIAMRCKGIDNHFQLGTGGGMVEVIMDIILKAAN